MQIPLFKKLPFEKVCHIPARARNPGLMALSPPHRRHGMGPGASIPPPPAATRGNGAADPPRSLSGARARCRCPSRLPWLPLAGSVAIIGVPLSSRAPREKRGSGGAGRGSSLKSNGSSKSNFIV